jgi:hypothetical protein
MLDLLLLTMSIRCFVTCVDIYLIDQCRERNNTMINFSVCV